MEYTLGNTNGIDTPGSPGIQAILDAMKSGNAKLVDAYPYSYVKDGYWATGYTDQPSGKKTLNVEAGDFFEEPGQKLLYMNGKLYPYGNDWTVMPVTKPVPTGEIGEDGQIYTKEVPTGNYRIRSRADNNVFDEVIFAADDSGKITGYNPNTYQTGSNSGWGGGFLGNVLGGITDLSKSLIATGIPTAILGGQLGGVLGGAGGAGAGIADAALLGGEYAGGLGATGALTSGILDAPVLGGEYLGGLGLADAAPAATIAGNAFDASNLATAGQGAGDIPIESVIPSDVTVGAPISSTAGPVTESAIPPVNESTLPISAQDPFAYTPPVDTMPAAPDSYAPPSAGIAPANPADFGATPDVIAPPEPSGPGYYDEVTGKWISDPNGALTGPIDPSQSGNVNNMAGWTANPSTGVWTDPSGNQYQSTPWDPTAAGTSGADIMKNAGSLPNVPGLGSAVKNALGSTIGNTGLTGAGALAGLGGLAGLLALIKSDSSRYGTPGRATYSGSLSQYKPPSFATYQPSIADPAMFRPRGGVTTVADQVAAQQASPLAQLASMAGFAKGGATDKKPQYKSRPQLAAMDPWTRAAAEYENAAYRAQSPVAPTAASVGPQLGQLNLKAGGELGGYSDGGRMLKGPGDGMSDSIPATISGKRPARLADGEFVVPADVVSHLGNGSTEAGARELYKMLDKVRQARTGNKKQGKQINPGKFVPK